MTILAAVTRINEILALPAMIIFVGIGVLLTFKLGFLQIRAFPQFLALIRRGSSIATHTESERIRTHNKLINPMHALFAAMSTTIGMGNVVGPSVAIIFGGPGALFWLVVYAFLGSITKFTEVVFALATRIKTADGSIIGGPMQYLRQVHPWIAHWYGLVMMFVFAIWSGGQANTLASVFAEEAIPRLLTGSVLGLFAFCIVIGGAHRVGLVASKLVPIMFFFYVSFALLILFRDLGALWSAICLVVTHAFGFKASVGGLMGYTIVDSMSWGISQSMYITEAGLGTSSIPHAMADVERPVEQGILAMFSLAADAFLSVLSGLLVLVTGVWLKVGAHENVNILMYEVFKNNSPELGRFVLIMSITLFVLTTVVGNSFNGSKSFASFTQHRFMTAYYLFTTALIVLGAVASSELVWQVLKLLVILVAVPNLLSIALLAFRYPSIIHGQKRHLSEV